MKVFTNTFPQTQTQTLPMSTFYTDRKDLTRHYFFIQVLTKGFEENWFRFDFTSCIWLVIFFSYLLNSFLIVIEYSLRRGIRRYAYDNYEMTQQAATAVSTTAFPRAFPALFLISSNTPLSPSTFLAPF